MTQWMETQMNTLIFTEPDDIHAALVKLALNKKGMDCQLLFTADMPTKQTNSIALSNDKVQWTSQSQTAHPLTISDMHFDAVWWRRPRRPSISETIHLDDQAFVKRENHVYHDSIPYLINAEAWWVNPYSSIKAANSKIVQLKYALELGFRVPETLVSNCPERIKLFIQSAGSKPVVYKPFTPHCWAEHDGLKLLYTHKISLADLTSDEALQALPGIYQQYIDKQFELRVTCFGTHISAVKIDSQSHPLGHSDWRKIPVAEMKLEAYTLPKNLEHKLIQMMKKIGVVFACFDFIVSKDGHIYFLELNEQGQFLWLEDMLPELYYLDRFVNFIIHKDFNFVWDAKAPLISSKALDLEAEHMVHQNIIKHVYLNQIKRVA